MSIKDTRGVTFFYFLGRGLDLFTTYLNYLEGGTSVELSPVGQPVMETYGFFGFVLFNLLVSLGLFLALLYFGRRWLMWLAIGSFYLISLWNMVIYLVVIGFF